MCSSTLSLTSALDGMVGQRHAPWEDPGTNCTGGWVGLRPVWTDAGKSRPPPEIRSPDCPACSESLYRLRYAGRLLDVLVLLIFEQI
jgi:hypothetical protein